MKLNKKVKNVLFITLFVILAIVIIALLLERWIMDYSPISQSNALSIPKVVQPLNQLENRDHDWPAWKGQQADNSSSFTKIKTDWSQGLNKLWEIDYLCQGKQSVTWSCPVIKGNRLIVPGRDENKDYIFCLDPDSGELIWYKRYKSDPGNNSFGIGARSTPTIDDDRVYTLSRGGKLIAWQLVDGKKIWSHDLNDLGGAMPQWGHATSPVVYGDLLIVQAGGQSILMAFNKFTGKLMWKTKAGEGSYSTPVIIKSESYDYITVLGGKYFYAFNAATGDWLWQEPFETSSNINIVTPPVDREQNIAVLSAWYGHGIKAVKIKPRNVNMIWENKSIMAHQSDPIIINDHIYSFSGMSSQNIGSFKCIELQTGNEKWSTNKIGNGQFIYVEPYFIALDLKGNLYLVKPDPNEFKLVSTFKDAIPDVGKRSWTKPVLAQGKLYLRYAHKLICYDISK